MDRMNELGPAHIEQVESLKKQIQPEETTEAVGGQLLKSKLEFGETLPIPGTKITGKEIKRFTLKKEQGKDQPMADVDLLEFIKTKFPNQIKVFYSQESDGNWYQPEGQNQDGTTFEEAVVLKLGEHAPINAMTLMHELGHAAQKRLPEYKAIKELQMEIFNALQDKRLKVEKVQKLSSLEETFKNLPEALQLSGLIESFKKSNQGMNESFQKNDELKQALWNVDDQADPSEWKKAIDAVKMHEDASVVPSVKKHVQERSVVRQKLEDLRRLCKQILERSADAHTLQWMRELNKTYGINLDQEFILPEAERTEEKATYNPRTNKNKALESYGATTKSMRQQYGDKTPTANPKYKQE